MGFHNWNQAIRLTNIIHYSPALSLHRQLPVLPALPVLQMILSYILCVTPLLPLQLVPSFAAGPRLHGT